MHSKEINWPFDTKDSRVSGTNCQVLINALTGKVGSGTQVTGNATYQAFEAWGTPQLASSSFIPHLK